jgi:hypothetical protein
MPLPSTYADILQVVLTGAASHAAAQTDPDASLGGFRSSTRCDGRSFLLLDAMSNLRVDLVSGANPTGDGIVTAIADDWVTWTSPGGAQGEAVQILSGQQRMLEDVTASRYVLVSRSNAQPLVGAMTVQIVEALNNVLGMGNADLSTPIKYRQIGFVNTSAGFEIQNLIVTVAANAGDVHLFTDSAQPTQPSGAAGSIVSETSSPSGVTTPGSTLALPTLYPGQWAPVWISRDIGVITPQPLIRSLLTWTFDLIG